MDPVDVDLGVPDETMLSTSAVASALNISPSTLRRIVHVLKLEPEAHRPRLGPGLRLERLWPPGLVARLLQEPLVQEARARAARRAARVDDVI